MVSMTCWATWRKICSVPIGAEVSGRFSMFFCWPDCYGESLHWIDGKAHVSRGATFSRVDLGDAGIHTSIYIVLLLSLVNKCSSLTTLRVLVGYITYFLCRQNITKNAFDHSYHRGTGVFPMQLHL